MPVSVERIKHETVGRVKKICFGLINQRPTSHLVIVVAGVIEVDIEQAGWSGSTTSSMFHSALPYADGRNLRNVDNSFQIATRPLAVPIMLRDLAIHVMNR